MLQILYFEYRCFTYKGLEGMIMFLGFLSVLCCVGLDKVHPLHDLGLANQIATDQIEFTGLPGDRIG